MNKTIVIHPDGTYERKEWPEGQRPELGWYNQQVEGYIEAVPYWQTFIDDDMQTVPCIAYCNEDGKGPSTYGDGRTEPLRYNLVADRAWDAALRRVRGADGLQWFPKGVYDLQDHLVGNIVVVIGDRWFQGEEDDDG
jgi:hypothetical protein